ncbi:hypothetical protein L1D54_22445 [Vibrio brasiliensis]|uniref:hypothetical protein n=1 Tax=Vibrio brasiliensis TaxID=170652 RepID=UPI001EFC6288|nr:hypothetical protein [Vibrio brasiliensis]MCG9753203.1 hypothetical protein [Vibrio brasiliensis]
MKSPQVIYIEMNKCKQQLDALYDQMKALEKNMMSGVEAIKPPESTGMIAKLNPMASMPDLDAIADIFADMPQYLELRAQERSFRQTFEKLSLELSQLLVNQYLQGGEHG